MSWPLACLWFLLAVALCCVLAFAVYSGICHRVIVSTDLNVISEMTLAYKFYTGPYKNCGASFIATARIAPGKTTVGIYYDDPGVIPADKQRYAVGCILSDKEGVLDEKAWRSLKDAGYTLKELPAPRVCVHTRFPCRTRLSIIMAVLRVYPRLDAYIKGNSLSWGPSLEIYEGDYIKFVVPQDQQNDFYVSEAVARSTPAAT